MDMINLLVSNTQSFNPSNTRSVSWSTTHNHTAHQIHDQSLGRQHTILQSINHTCHQIIINLLVSTTQSFNQTVHQVHDHSLGQSHTRFLNQSSISRSATHTIHQSISHQSLGQPHPHNPSIHVHCFQCLRFKDFKDDFPWGQEVAGVSAQNSHHPQAQLGGVAHHHGWFRREQLPFHVAQHLQQLKVETSYIREASSASASATSTDLTMLN